MRWNLGSAARPGEGQLAVYALVVAQSKPTPEPVAVPKALEPLVKQLASLAPAERELVVHAAEAVSHARPTYPAMPWEVLDVARGLASFGGDAVEDTRALYDG